MSTLLTLTLVINVLADLLKSLSDLLNISASDNETDNRIRRWPDDKKETVVVFVIPDESDRGPSVCAYRKRVIPFRGTG